VIAERSRGELAAAAVALVAVIGLVAAVVIGHRWWSGEGGSFAPRQALVSTDVLPARSLFGEPLTARARVVVDPRVVDVKHVALGVDFKPYSVRSESRRVSSGLGRASIVEFSYTLQCTARQCLPRGGGRAAAAEIVQLRRATLTLPQRTGGSRTRRVSWPPAAVQSRLTGDEIGLSTPHAARRAAPAAVTWGISPRLVGGLAFAGALLAALCAAWLIATVVRRDLTLVRALRIPSHLTPVDRALVLAEHAAAHGEVEESRKALERLAIELRHRQAAAEAARAERLAWSERDPSQASIRELADAVRSNGTH
jgi:hypothetical protein